MNHVNPVTPLFPPLDAAATPDQEDPSATPGGVLDALLRSPRYRQLIAPSPGLTQRGRCDDNVIDLRGEESALEVEVDLDLDLDLGLRVARAIACR